MFTYASIGSAKLDIITWAKEESICAEKLNEVRQRYFCETAVAMGTTCCPFTMKTGENGKNK